MFPYDSITSTISNTLPRPFSSSCDSMAQLSPYRSYCPPPNTLPHAHKPPSHPQSFLTIPIPRQSSLTIPSLQQSPLGLTIFPHSCHSRVPESDPNRTTRRVDLRIFGELFVTGNLRAIFRTSFDGVISVMRKLVSCTYASRNGVHDVYVSAMDVMRNLQLY